MTTKPPEVGTSTTPPETELLLASARHLYLLTQQLEATEKDVEAARGHLSAHVELEKAIEKLLGLDSETGDFDLVVEVHALHLERDFLRSAIARLEGDLPRGKTGTRLREVLVEAEAVRRSARAGAPVVARGTGGSS